jgi:hypothetical protein
VGVAGIIEPGTLIHAYCFDDERIVIFPMP